MVLFRKTEADQIRNETMKLKSQVDQLSQLSDDQIETLLQVPPGFDFSKIPTDLNNLTFDTAVTLLDNVDPNDLPILADDEYYDDACAARVADTNAPQNTVLAMAQDYAVRGGHRLELAAAYEVVGGTALAGPPFGALGATSGSQDGCRATPGE